MSLSLSHLTSLDISKEDLRLLIARDEYKQSPDAWVREKLQEHIWSKQSEIFQAIRDNKRVAVKSCHNSGKSFIAARIAAWWIDVHPPGQAFVVTSAPSQSQVRAILWREIGRVHAKGKLAGRVNQTEWWVETSLGNEEMVAYGRKTSDIDPTSFQGIHAPHVLVIFDEACGMHANLWNAADTLISNEGSKLLAIGNPDDPVTEFASNCKPGSGYKVIKISAYDTPNFTNEPVPSVVTSNLISKSWADEKKTRWGESNPLYISKVLGEFPEYSSDGLIPLTWIISAQERDISPSYPLEIGCDVGGGGNESTIALRQGSKIRIIHADNNPNTMATLGTLIRLIRETGATKAKVDYIGIGKGAVDRAQEISKDDQDPNNDIAKRIVGIRVSDPSERNAKEFRNLRAEGYWNLRMRFENGDIDIDPNDDDLAAQLVEIKYESPSGRIKIEGKKELLARGKPSPDRADAVMLAFLEDNHAPREVRLTWGTRKSLR